MVASFIKGDMSLGHLAIGMMYAVPIEAITANIFLRR